MENTRPKYPEPGWSNAPPGDVVQQLPQRDAAAAAAPAVDKTPEPPAPTTTGTAALSEKSQKVTPPKVTARKPAGKRAGKRART